MDRLSPMIILAAAAGFFALSVLLLILWLREHGKRREAQKQLELQKERVMVRKQKIMELRGQIEALHARVEESERKLLGSYTMEEINAGYEGIAGSIRDLLRCAESRDQGVSGRGSMMAAAVELSGRIKNAFHMKEDMNLNTSPEASVDAAESGSGIRGRVLVVDDNELNRELCVELMEISGFLVDQAENGEEAVEKFRKSREGYYDVILMDVIMPVKNGYEACREIRKLFRSDSERVPVIAVTANSFAEDYVQLQDAGMNDRIVKPVNQDVLLAMVNKWMHYDRENEETLRRSVDWSSLPSSERDEEEDYLF